MIRSDLSAALVRVSIACGLLLGGCASQPSTPTGTPPRVDGSVTAPDGSRPLGAGDAGLLFPDSAIPRADGQVPPPTGDAGAPTPPPPVPDPTGIIARFCAADCAWANGCGYLVDQMTGAAVPVSECESYCKADGYYTGFLDSALEAAIACYPTSGCGDDVPYCLYAAVPAGEAAYGGPAATCVTKIRSCNFGEGAEDVCVDLHVIKPEAAAALMSCVNLECGQIEECLFGPAPSM